MQLLNSCGRICKRNSGCNAFIIEGRICNEEYQAGQGSFHDGSRDGNCCHLIRHPIELGYIYIDPIMQSCFVCVGIDENGSMHNLPTPSDIVSRTYDIGIFDNVEITRYPNR